MSIASMVTLSVLAALSPAEPVPGQERNIVRTQTDSEGVVSDALAARTGWRIARGFQWPILLGGAEGTFRPARPDQTFATGQAFRLEVEADNDLWIYILNRAPDGSEVVLLPEKGEEHLLIRRGERVVIPPTGQFRFEDPSGAETFRILAAPQQLAWINPHKLFRWESGAKLDPRESELARYQKEVRTKAIENLPSESPPAPVGASDTPKLVLETGGFTSRVSSLDFSPDGRWLAAAGWDKTVRIWDLGTGQLRATLRGYDGVAFVGVSLTLAFTPNSRYLLVRVQDIAPEGTIRVYDMSDPGQIAELLPAHPLGGTLELAFSDDGAYLATVGTDNKLVLWDWPARRPRHQVDVQGPVKYLGFPFPKLPILVVIDGRSRPHLWHAIRGKEVRWSNMQEFLEVCKGLGDPDVLAKSYQHLRTNVQASNKIRLPYSGVDNQVRLYLDTGHLIAGGRGTKNNRDCYWVALWTLANGGQMVWLHEDHNDVPTAMREREPVSALALNLSRTLAASADFLGNIHVWEVETGRQLYLFRGGGHPIYRVAFEASGRQLAFGTKPYETGRWYYNHFASPEQTFNLESRRHIDGAPGTHLTEVTRQGERELSLKEVDSQMGNNAIHCTRQGQPERAFPRGFFMCYTFLRSKHPGFEDPVVLGEADGTLSCRDPRTGMTRRSFLGHTGAVMSLSESPDGRLLASSSTDRTIRIWSLENFQERGDLDFDVDADGTIRNVVLDSSAEQAGVRAGDRLLAMDGIDLATLVDRFAKGPWGFRPGQRVTVDLVRGDQPYRVTVPLACGGDYVEPLLSLFMAGGEWVLWTPQGYYDASLGGDRLIGWHLNQGRSREAKFYLAQQFHTQFCRPDVIDCVLQTGDVARAVELANAARPRLEEPLDIRRTEVLGRLEPPRVRIVAPTEGTVTSSDRITVRAEVRSQNNWPIRDVTILVNGRPAPGKGIVREPGAPQPQQLVVERAISLQPGRNALSVVATNEVSASQPATVAVTYEATEPSGSKPKLYLLAIGISRYAHEEYNLQFARADAEAFAAAWKSQKGAAYSEVQTQVLTDEHATGRAIREGIEWLVQSATQRDVTVLFLSAHGINDTRLNYYLATYEIDQEHLWSTAVRWNEFEGLIQDVPGKFLLFNDTCHAGGITGAKGLGDDPLRKLVSEETGAVVFASSLPREMSREGPRWRHGAFTKAILDTFQDQTADRNGDGYLSLTELHGQLTERVKELTRGRQHVSVAWPPTISDFNFYRLVEAPR